MSVDYGEKERQFLATLKADTGRDIDEWLAAIAAAGLAERNEIIDWLRRQGFMFSKASWIERIHNNRGRPIYAGHGAPRARAEPRTNTPAHPPAELSPAPPPPTLKPASPAPPSPAPQAPAQPAAAAAAPLPASTAPTADLDALLARAKAYRPLANFVVAEIRKAVPGVAVLPHQGYLAFRTGGRDFAILAVTPRELRLALATGTLPDGLALEPARFSPPLKGAPAVTHMTVLTDARQVTPALMSAVSEAARGR